MVGRLEPGFGVAVPNRWQWKSITFPRMFGRAWGRGNSRQCDSNQAAREEIRELQ